MSHITFPNDLQIAPADENPWAEVAPARAPETAPVYIAARTVPADADLRRAADVLNAGTRVVLLAGAGALGARAELLEVAEVLGSPIVKTLPGKAAVPDDHPLTTGGIGLLGTRPSEEAMEAADTLLMVGTNFPYTKHLPPTDQVRTVQIEIDPTRAGNRMPTEVPLIGDAAPTLRALLPLLRTNTDRGLLEHAQSGMRDWRQKMTALENADRDPIAPQYLIGVINRLAADDAILCCDSGTIATWAARHFDIRGDRQFFLSGNLATMAPGLPYSIAMQWAFPGRQCVAFVGDGGFAMLMAEFLTAIRHELPVKVFVNNNAEYGQILWEQMVLGYPEFGVRHSKTANFSAFATANGATGIRVERAEEVEVAVKDGVRASGAGTRGRAHQSRRAAHAPEGQLRAGEEVRASVRAGSAAQGDDRLDHLPRQDFGTPVMTAKSDSGFAAGVTNVVERTIRNVEHGRFERTLAGVTAIGAVVTGAEVFLAHDRASFGNKMMWLPVAFTPVLATAGVAGVVNRRMAKQLLPLVSAGAVFNGLQGTYLHLRGISQRPGGFRLARYNAEMGPPMFAPLLYSLVGGMGLVAAILRRER